MMHRPKEWVTLALTAALAAGGCGDAPRRRAVARQSRDVAPVAARERDELKVSQPPAAFDAPSRLLRLPPAPVTLAAKPVVHPIQAQYAQADAPAAAEVPTDPIWTLPAPAQPAAGDLRQPAQPPSVYEQPAATQPLPPTAAPRDAMQPVAEQAAAMSRRAYQMAQKGMLFTARNELVQSLRLVAQALDVQQRTDRHAAALSAGLIALEEADDFAPQPGREAAVIDVATIARGHRTPLLKEARDVSPVVAQQQYFNFAQQQLADAVAGERAASQSLFTLGKIQMALAGQSAEPQSLYGPRAMVFHQAALAVDGRNYLAANELGVLLARYGQLTDARRALLHSVSLRSHAEGWHNLAIVHERLGESELARLAQNERQLLAQRPTTPSATRADEKAVEWVDARTFAAHGPQNNERR
jgi:hypothetical protein